MTWFVVGGIAVGATAGAIVGSKKGGDDVWKDALIGGAIGGTAGAGAGVAGGAGILGGIGAEGAAGAGIAGAEAAGLGAADAAVASGAGVGAIAPATAAVPEAAAGASPGIIGAAAPEAATSTGGMGTLANLTPTELANVTAQANANTAAGLGPWTSPEQIQMVSPPAQGGGFGTAEPFSGTPKALPGSNEPFGTAGKATVGGNQSMFDKALGWVEENPFKAGILGFTALGMSGALNKNNNQTFGGSTVTSAGYPLSADFQPTRVNPQQYRYKSSYADGGIASVGQQGDMFPQSQMDKTQFATPSQMPVSREVVNADYDTVTNPYIGDQPRFAKGGSIDWGNKAQDYATMLEAQKSEPVQTPRYVSHSQVDPTDTGIAVDTDVDTRDQPAMTAAQTRMSKLAKKYGVNYAPASSPESTRNADMAGGGITSLGGYASGGNPRLLRGPGDGMSDDIPATIADKQPARLADGEFVVPADVVSGLGNGSTEAGAKKLHQMMDKVRVDRTGTKKQGKQIKAEKYVPGMASGGIASYAEGGDTKKDDTVAIQAAPSQPAQAQVPAGQYAMGGQQTPDYRVPGSTLSGNLGRWSNVAGEAERAARPASLNQQVTQSYLQNLGRAPDQQGFNYWMDSGLTGQQINKTIQASPESIQRDPTNVANVNALIEQMYQQNLGRTADQAGRDYWAKQITGGQANPYQIIQGIKGSPEAQVRQAYQDILGRMPDAEGSQYWQQQMGQGMTADQLRASILGTQEGQTVAASRKKKTEAANPNLVKTQTVQDMIDAALKKQQEDMAAASQQSNNYNYYSGNRGGKVSKRGILAAKK